MPHWLDYHVTTGGMDGLHLTKSWNGRYVIEGATEKPMSNLILTKTLREITKAKTSLYEELTMEWHILLFQIASKPSKCKRKYTY